jgi:DNA-binding GntR family transcriptional regulator
MDKLQEKDDVEALSPLAREFHWQLTCISGQKRILRVIESQDEYIRRFSAMAIRQENRRSAAHHEHHLLVDYVEEKNLDKFTELTKSHIERSMENCLAALASQNQNREL